MSNKEIYFNDVQKEIDSTKIVVKTKTITVHKNEKKTTVLLPDVENKLDSTKDEIFLNSKAEKNKTRVIKRGEIYFCNLGFGVGSEMRKMRPCVVLSNDVNNYYSSNVVIAPITHTQKSIKCFVLLTPKKDNSDKIILDGSVNTSNIRTISKARLGDFITNLSKIELKSVDESLYDALGLISTVKGMRNRVTTIEKQMKFQRSSIMWYKNQLYDCESESRNYREQIWENRRYIARLQELTGAKSPDELEISIKTIQRLFRRIKSISNSPNFDELAKSILAEHSNKSFNSMEDISE